MCVRERKREARDLLAVCNKSLNICTRICMREVKVRRAPACTKAKPAGKRARDISINVCVCGCGGVCDCVGVATATAVAALCCTYPSVAIASASATLGMFSTRNENNFHFVAASDAAALS